MDWEQASAEVSFTSFPLHSAKVHDDPYLSCGKGRRQSLGGPQNSR